MRNDIDPPHLCVYERLRMHYTWRYTTTMKDHNERGRGYEDAPLFRVEVDEDDDTEWVSPVERITHWSKWFCGYQSDVQ